MSKKKISIKFACFMLTLLSLSCVLFGCGNEELTHETEKIAESTSIKESDIDAEESDTETELETESLTETAAENETETECSHEFGEWETVSEPTCTVTGEKTQTCIHCGVINHSVIDKLGHTEIVDEGKSATCTENGFSEGSHCEVCGEVIKAQTEIEALGHVEIASEPVAPTCESTGITDHTYCEVCGITIKEGKVVEKTSHSPVTDKAVAPTTEKTGLTEGSHCKYCGKTLVEQEVVPVLSSRNGGYITTAKTKLKAEHVTFTIPKNVFVRDDLVEWTNIITDVMEKLTGFRFEGKSAYSDGVIECEVKKNGDNEFGGAYAWPGEIMVCPFDLMTTNGSSLYHELTHTLQFAQSKWRYSELAMEGFAVYSTYKGMQYLEEHYPEIAFSMATNETTFHNMSLRNYEKLYEHPMEYWMENIISSEYSSNGNYVIGFRFMWFLDEVYGNYTAWITEYEKHNPYKNAKDKTMTAKMEAEAFKLAYGDDVFEKFYSWLRENEDLFRYRETKDITNLHFSEVYPSFYFIGPSVSIPPFIHASEVTYDDLLLDLEPMKFYLSKYKKMNIDSLVLKIDETVTVELYDYDGVLIGTVTGPEISLVGVSSIRLVGKGVMTRFRIEGFY